jgi:hypothetical protein
MRDMKPCPVCGVLLAAALADAIGNDKAPETCPMEATK